MTSALDSQKLNHVFKSRPDIVKGVQQAADSPSRVKLFNSIVDFVYEQLNDIQPSEPAQKRRRVDIEPSQNGNDAVASSADSVAQEDVLLEIKDISVSIPQRKKFDLCFTAQHLYARIPGTKTPVPNIIYSWKSIDYAFYLPVPEKAQVQHNYVLLPQDSYFPSQATASPVDPLVFTIPATAPKPGSIGGPNAGAASAVADSYSTLFYWAINKCLQAGGKQVQIVAADSSKFHSVIRQPHRPKEQAVHVKAFRGSKDGYIFFLENGIFWGFKKPLMFLPLEKIAAISYTSVLQRTFNMAVEIYTGSKTEDGQEDATEEIEFAMLDQEDYSGINENYVMRHRLQDRSLADQRKAKRELVENLKGKKGASEADQEENSATAGDGMTELERAQHEAEQQLQDEEDEDEEDYDPGSEGESEGSGTSSDDNDDDDDDDDDNDEDEGDDGDGDGVGNDE
ncbi:hypothetical protein F5Y17DRAFT_304878 [Xylariaceae sp. FL0594]|nr:hypothetical protein F5Y17DRAFT_304878 [Xylariaceae sp. FL0594]